VPSSRRNRGGDKGQSVPTPPPVEDKEQERYLERRHRLEIVRGYVMVLVGVGLIVFAFVPPIKPASMTLGGAMIGFNPILQSIGGRSAGEQSG
jgi:hypothetical protein